MDLIIEYLIAKGGGFGVLLAIALSWIVFRERALLSQKSEKEEEKPPAPPAILKDPDIVKLLTLVEELKADSDKNFHQVLAFNPLLEQIYNIDKSGKNSIEKVNVGIAHVNTELSNIDKKIKDLWDWHSVRDNEGVPVWYHRRGHADDSINKLKEAIDNLDRNFMQITKSMCSDLDERLQKVNDERVAELKKLLEAYNKTVTDLIVALEKIKFLLKSREEVE